MQNKEKEERERGEWGESWVYLSMQLSTSESLAVH